MTEQEAIQRLRELGWLADGADVSLEAALFEYQVFSGLPPTGELDAATIDSLQRPRMCGFPDKMRLGEYRTLPLQTTWRFSGPLSPLSDADVRAAIQTACDNWSRVCPITMAMVTGASNLAIAVANIDGRNGVLADCELPGPQVQHMRLDRSEGWTIPLPPGPSQIALINVVTHELGHYLGLDHLPGTGALMNPYYDPNISTPQAADIRAIQGLYPGKPAIGPEPTPTPTPGTGATITLTVRGVTGGAELLVNGVKQKVGPA